MTGRLRRCVGQPFSKAGALLAACCSRSRVVVRDLGLLFASQVARIWV